LKRLLLISAIVVTTLLAGRGVQYYAENTLYARHIVASYMEARNSVVEDGYTDRQSYGVGDRQEVYINAEEEGKATVRLYNLLGQAVDSVHAVLVPQEPADNPSEEGFGYEATFIYNIPKLRSGLYLWEKKIPFVVKSEAAPVVVLYPTNTVNAYTVTGGKSLYSIFSEQTHRVSFQRPTFPAVSFQSIAAMEWLATSPYDIKYIVDQDLEDSSVLDGAKVLVMVGHNEYWTRKARKTVDAFVDGGGHCAVLSGNTMWWQIRYTDDGSGMICYKTLPDPIQDPLLKTVNWSEEVLQYPIYESIGVDFRFGGFGRKSLKSFGGYKIINSQSPLFEGTNLKSGDILQVPSKELDGTFLLHYPNGLALDTTKLNFYKAALLGYERTIEREMGYGTFLVFQKTPSSGVVVNVATTDWCSPYGMGGEDGDKIKKITTNIIDGLLHNKDMFSN
jgi:hypothetical protein